MPHRNQCPSFPLPHGNPCPHSNVLALPHKSPCPTAPGYSDPNLYNTRLGEEAAAAFQKIAEVLLADESMLALTCFIRPVRPPPAHQADAAQRYAELPAWCKRALGVPFTQVWCL